MDKRKILVQLDPDPHPSLFDRVVASDAGAEEIFSYGNVKPPDVMGLIHGAIFTRGPKDLHRTAFFIGGSVVSLGEQLFAEAQKHLLPQFGLRVSLILDANGCNTTAAAAVLAARQHLDLSMARAIVLAGTGPVGQRVARLLAREGALVRVGSRKKDKAATVCQAIAAQVSLARLEPWATGTEEETTQAIQGQTLVVAAGAAGILLLSKAQRALISPTLKVAIDLNAVPPLGLEGVEVGDKGKDREGVFCYGALGVGAAKMKIHRAAIAQLFERNDLTMDAEEVYALTKGM